MCKSQLLHMWKWLLDSVGAATEFWLYVYNQKNEVEVVVGFGGRCD